MKGLILELARFSFEHGSTWSTQSAALYLFLFVLFRVDARLGHQLVRTSRLIAVLPLNFALAESDDFVTRDSAINQFLCCAPKTGNVNFLVSGEMLPHLFLERGIIDSSRHALRTFDKLTNWQSDNPLSYTRRAITR